MQQLVVCDSDDSIEYWWMGSPPKNHDTFLNYEYSSLLEINTPEFRQKNQ